MLNYEVDPSLLNQYVPRGTSLDSFQGKTYLSLVGFRFFRTKMLGYFPIPFHANFDEVNLRFYVRHKEGSEDRRGVVFIAEVVPRRAIAATARLLYGENYICLPMRRRVETEELRTTFEYHWKVNDNWSKLSVQTLGAPTHPREGSLKQFITEHYWGYSKQRAAVSNIASRTNRGKYGRRVAQNLKETSALSTGSGSLQFLSGPQTARSSPMARLSSCSRAIEFNDAA
jgi:uncharacterized protein